MKKNNCIGIFGGMGPQASAEFYRIIIEKAKTDYHAHTGNAYPEIVIDSVPVPDCFTSTKRLEEAAVLLEDRVQRLSTFGATILALSCNTIHVLFSRLQKKTSVPMVSIIDEVTKKACTQSKNILLLASPITIEKQLYQTEMKNYTSHIILPMEKDISKLGLIIQGVLEGKDKQFLQSELITIVNRCIHTHPYIDGIILGCTELPLVFPSHFHIPVYNSLSLLADSLLKQYYKKEDI